MSKGEGSRLGQSIQMSGIIIPILDKRVFEFGFLGTAATQDVVIHPAVDTASYYRVRLLVRTHSITATSGNFKFNVYNTFPSEQDPQEFTDATTLFITGTSITTASPNIYSPASSVDPQAFLKIVLRATQGTSGNTLYGEFSAALLLREF